MAKTATERHAHYRHHVAAYLRAVEIARGWSQSEIARQVGVLSTTINKALKLRHSMDYTTLLALEAASDIPIHEELRLAAATLKAPAWSPRPKSRRSFRPRPNGRGWWTLAASCPPRRTRRPSAS